MSYVDEKCIEFFGITFDWFNETPYGHQCYTDNDWKEYIENKKNDPVKTYQERFSREPEIIDSSDPEKITVLNNFAVRLNTAYENDNIEQLKMIAKEISEYRELLESNPLKIS